ELIACGYEIKQRLDDTEYAKHPEDDRLSGIYGTILYEDLADTADGPHQRNVTVFADGEVDRSPCGSGTAARAAVLAADGRLPNGQVLTHDSIIGTSFSARTLPGSSPSTVVPEIAGNAYPIGEHTFVLADDDPLRKGFVLR